LLAGSNMFTENAAFSKKTLNEQNQAIITDKKFNNALRENWL